MASNGLRWRLAALTIGVCALRSVGAASIWEVGKPQGDVEVVDDLPKPADFFTRHVLGKGTPMEGKGIGWPAHFRGAAKKMPAYKLWTDDYLRKRHGKVIMDQVETEKRETRTKMPHEDWNLAKFLDNYNKSEIYSTATTPPGIKKDVYFLPIMNCGGFNRRLESTVMWFSSGSTRSVIHNDGQQNVHCMFAGEKNWIIWRKDTNIRTREMGWVHGEEEAKKNPNFKDTYGAYVGLLDVDNVDLEKFPGWGELEWWNMTLKAGDCAFIPGGWYHFVEAPPQRSISVHAWFHSPSKFDHKSCERMAEKGYDASQYLISFADCTWEEGKKTSCKVKKPKASKAKETNAEL